MIFVKVNPEKGGLDAALKQFKNKVQKTKLVKELRERQKFVKPSESKREQIKKAVYSEKFKHEKN